MARANSLFDAQSSMIDILNMKKATASIQEFGRQRSSGEPAWRTLLGCWSIGTQLSSGCKNVRRRIDERCIDCDSRHRDPRMPVENQLRSTPEATDGCRHWNSQDHKAAIEDSPDQPAPMFRSG
jgi:hypothetical protein